MKILFKNIVFMNLFPVIIINVLFLPALIIVKILLRNVVIPGDYELFNRMLYIKQLIPLFEIIFNIIINPIYLSITNMIYTIRTNKRIYIKNIFLMFLSGFIGLIMYFLNWCISEGDFTNHDWKDIMLAKYMVIFTFVIILIIGIFEQIFLLVKYNKKN
jgi:intein/homing endonuclease